MMRAFQWTRGRAKRLCHLCFPGFNWYLDLRVLPVLQEMPQCGLSMGCSSFGAYPSAPVQFSPDATVGISSSVPGAPSHPFFPSLPCILVFFSCSLICSHRGATSTTVMLAVPCVWVHYGAAWQHLCGTGQPLIFSNRGHPAALLLPTQCHINSWESKQQSWPEWHKH